MMLTRIHNTFMMKNKLVSMMAQMVSFIEEEKHLNADPDTFELTIAILLVFRTLLVAILC